jgi:signal peptidase
MTAPPGSVRFSPLIHLSIRQRDREVAMRIIRFLGNVALWFGALLGVVAGGVWVADQLGWVQPLIVISGSMEPNIGTGDLLISRNLATDDVEVGDVVSLHSEMTDKLVTHRVTEVSPNGDGTWTISMKGDANDEPDLETYTVGASVLTPVLQIPQGGKVVSKLMEPAVALPILLSLVALLGISLLDEPARSKADRRKRQAAEPDVGSDDDVPGDDITGADIASEVIASSDGIPHDENAGDKFTHDDTDDTDDAGREITRELPVVAVDVEPAGSDPIEDLDEALASVGARVDARVDAPADGLGDAAIDGLDDVPLDAPGDALGDDLDLSLDDVDVAVGYSDGSHDIDDLDAALAALGIDVTRLPAVSRNNSDPDAAGSGSSDAYGPERRSDERDLVMTG